MPSQMRPVPIVFRSSLAILTLIRSGLLRNKNSKNKKLYTLCGDDDSQYVELQGLLLYNIHGPNPAIPIYPWPQAILLDVSQCGCLLLAKHTVQCDTSQRLRY